MRKAEIYQQGELAGLLEEVGGNRFRFVYAPEFKGQPISLALPVGGTAYEFDRFPPVFEGLLPEGVQLEAMLRRFKVDKEDLFQQLVMVGADVVGSLTAREVK